jgi:ectoine hydroxylase-related dioxygenase (phytanoyl-CoA dioxygenase family)
MDSFPSSDPVRSITQAEISSFALDGVVHLPEIVDKDWIDLLDSSLKLMLNDPQMFADLTALGSNLNETQGLAVLTDSDVSGGRFLSGVDHWKEDKNFAAFAKISPLPSIVAELMNSKKVYLYEDSVLIKEPGTAERTAFHQDLGYFHLEGESICTVWTPLDDVDSETGGVVYLRSSHKNKKVFKPNWFVVNESLPGTEGKDLPNIKIDDEKLDLIRFDTKPGDLVVHHALTLHGAGSNSSVSRQRRAVSVRYCGDGSTYKIRSGAPKKPHHENMRTGDPVLDHPDCPLVWG